jgi:guanosine-3',5'-bis(diphosphate) 3'-pyrophosphohydrolase
MDEINSLAAILKALHFSADKHRRQRRKDVEASPYINHPIEVGAIFRTGSAARGSGSDG